MSARRIVRSGIYHSGTFRSILQQLDRLEGCLHYRGRYWRLIARQDGVSLYREQSDPLEWLRERVADYDEYMVSRLAMGVVGRDGILRARTTRVVRTARGYRQR